MTRRRPLNLVMTAICGVLLAGAAACSSGGTSASSTTSAAAVESQQTEDSLPPPPPESTGAEQPQSQQNQPSVTLAALPVGGNGKDFEDSNPKCVLVNLTGLTLPDSVRIKITMVLIAENPDTKTADFAVVGDGGGCPDNPCPGYIFTSGNGPCDANIAPVKPSSPRFLDGAVYLSGDCIAPDEVTCRRVKDAVDKASGARVGLTSHFFESSSASSSEASQSGAENSSSSEESQSSAESSSGSSG
jgi:hypothetical protein